MAMASAAESLSRGRTPGTFVGFTIFTALGTHNLADIPLLFAMFMAVDGAICFAILWGGYLLWKKVRGAATRRNLEAGK
jgi:hypothetical protein